MFFDKFITSSSFKRPPLWKTIIVFFFGIPNIFLSVLYRYTLRVGKVEIEPIHRCKKGTPIILYSWHRNSSYLCYLVYMVRALQNVTFIGNDYLSSLISTIPMSFFGFLIFSFSRRRPLSGTEQISEYLKTNKTILLFPDSGGPYLKVRKGLIRMAQASGAMVIPIAATARPRFVVGCRMRHRYPFPGAKLNCMAGKPVELIAKGAPNSEEQNIHRCEQALMSLQKLYSHW